MGWLARSDSTFVEDQPFLHSYSGLAAGAFFAYGFGGNVNPGARATSGGVGTCMVDPILYNAGSVSLFVGADLAAMQLDDRSTEIPASAPPLQLPGTYASLYIYNPVGAASSQAWSLTSKMARQPNSDTVTAGHPGHALEHSGIVEAVPGGTAQIDFTVQFAMTVTGVWVWAPATPTSTLGTYLMTVAKNDTNNMLAAANFDLETLSAGVAKKDIALTATSEYLTMVPGDTINIDATSDNADLVDGDFAVLIAASEA